MPKMPPRRALRSIVHDAIRDREAFDDQQQQAETADLLARYRSLMGRLADEAPALDDVAKDDLAMACLHARIWREGYLDAWIGTNDGQVIQQCRHSIDRVTRTEAALGIRYRREADVAAEKADMVSIFDLMKRAA